MPALLPEPSPSPVTLGPWDTVFMHILGKITVGTIQVTLADGQTFTVRGQTPGPDVRMRLLSADVGKAVMLRGSVGFGETYTDGQWTTPNLPRLLYFFVLNLPSLQSELEGKPWQRRLQTLLRWLSRNTRRGSRRNIAAHYDLGNDFYAAWLDDSMSYSSGLFPDAYTTLEEAQTLKYQRILDELPPLTDKHQVLEIGCGWGGFLEHLTAKSRARVTGLTISSAQAAYANQRLARQSRAAVKTEDYRDHQGRYHHIVSVEMLEAVGRDYWPVYFRRLKEMLMPGGKIVLQTITMEERYFADYAARTDFIQAHVFPGGFLPTLEAIQEQAAGAYLRVEKTFRFGTDYARTLELWRERFNAAWPAIARLPAAQKPFDERFRRLWEYYLAYCEAGFLAGRVDVCQLTLVHAPE